MPCPELDQLIDLLEDRLDGETFERLAGHIQGCPDCQGRLDHLTDSRTGLAGFLTEPMTIAPGPNGIADTDAGETGTFASGSRVNPSSPSCLQTEEVGGATVSLAGIGVTRPHLSDAVENLKPSRREASRGVAVPVVPGYLIEGELGQGGMGVVYRARHLGLKRPVALKMIRDGGLARPDQRGRFLLEAEVVAELKHPNIVQIYDTGEAGGLPFVALELLDGGTLSDRIKGTPQPLRASAELLVILAEAMEAAHRAHVLHRDLKPANILFDGDGTPKIADFGLAKRTDLEDSGHTQTGQIMGSPSYMAPEQADGKTREFRPATDVYALGAILYEMLTGRPPFKGESAMETVKQVLEAEVVPPSRLRPKLPRDLETICLACLRKDASKRYPSAAALADDLRRYLSGRPILARRVSPWEKAWKWGRRNPMAASLLILGIVAVIGGSAGAVWYDGRLKAEQRREDNRVAALRSEVGGDIRKVQQLLDRRVWSDALATLSGLKKGLEREPRLADLRRDVDVLLGDADKIRLGEDNRKEADGSLDLFGQARDRALFHDFSDFGFSGESEDHIAATRDSAREALALFSDPGKKPGAGWTIVLPTILTPAECAKVRDGCNELLLVLAGATLQTRAGESPKVQATEALAILDDAARLTPPTGALLLQRASCLSRLGRREEAAKVREAVEKTRPTTPLDHYLVGRERLTVGDLAEARRHFDETLQLEPDHFWAHALSAVVQLGLKHPGEARTHLNVCLQSQSHEPFLYRLRGDAAWQMVDQILPQAAARPAEAKALLAQAEDLSKAAEEDYERALKGTTSPASLYATLVNRGALRFQLANLDGAAADFDRAIALQPDRYQAYASRSEVHRRRGEIDQAEALLTKAIGLTPDRPELYRSRALLVKEQGRMTKERRAAALADLEKSASLEPKSNRSRIARDGAERAFLLFGDQRYEEARSVVEQALKGDPNLGEAHRVHIASLLELGRHEDLLEACNAALKHGAPEVAIREMRGLARVALRDFSGAIEDFTLAIAQQPRSAKLLSQRGWAFVFADSPTLALTDFDRAIASDPKHGDAHSGRGFAQALLGKDREALTEAEEAVKLAGDEPQVLYQAARTYAVAIDRAERTALRGNVTNQSPRAARAIALLRKALELATDDRREILSRGLRTDPALESLRRRGDLPRSAPSRPLAAVGPPPTPTP